MTTEQITTRLVEIRDRVVVEKKRFGEWDDSICSIAEDALTEIETLVNKLIEDLK